MGHDSVELKIKLRNALQLEETPKPYNVWRHYKGDYYIIHFLSIRESTEDIEVCYTSISDDDDSIVWTRPLSEWNDTVIYNGIEQKRFIKIDCKDDIKFIEK